MKETAIKTKYWLSNRGFTVIEFLLYIGLFVLVLTGILIAAFQVIEASNANQEKIGVHQEANFLMRKLDWALVGATDITATDTTLSVTRPDLGSDSPLLFSLDHTTGDLSFQRGVFAPVVLNSSATEIAGVSGKLFDFDSATKRVETTMMINDYEFDRVKYLR